MKYCSVGYCANVINETVGIFWPFGIKVGGAGAFVYNLLILYNNLEILKLVIKTLTKRCN